MRRMKAILAVAVLLVAMLVASAAPAMAADPVRGNTVTFGPNAFRNADVNNVGCFNAGVGCNNLNDGFNTGFFSPFFTGFSAPFFFENEQPCGSLLLIQTSQTLCIG